ncbi:MAG TPA: hypothetical protein DEQ06_01835 [Porphyromonadaceae bacterium]|nr:hypothetical protein [Porphyromonadaceae bacterium]
MELAVIVYLCEKNVHARFILHLFVFKQQIHQFVLIFEGLNRQQLVSDELHLTSSVSYESFHNTNV